MLLLCSLALNTFRMNNSLGKFLVQEPSVSEDMGKVAAKIAYYNFDWRYITIVMFHAFQYMAALDTFLSRYNQSVIIKFGKYLPERRFPVPQFVVFGQDTYEIVDTILWLDKSRYDNAGKYIIICTSYDYIRCDEMQIFMALSHVKIVNIVYLRGQSDEDFESLSYNIVLPGKCMNSDPYTIDIQTNCSNDNCFKAVFPEKLKNFNRCPLTVSTFEQPPFMYLNNETLEPFGNDGDLIKIVANALNATLVIKIPAEGNDWGHYERKNWTGSLGDVFNDRVHVSVCSLPVTPNKYGNFQISLVYNTMDIVWTAATPMLKPSWQKLLNPLDSGLRFALFLTFAGISCLNSALKSKICKRFLRVYKIGPIRSNLLFYSWALFLGIPILKMPKKRPLRILVYSWIWYCFVIKNAYQAALISSLKTQIFEDYFMDFKSVLKSKRPFGGLSTYREYYANDKYIYDNWVVMDMDSSYDTLNNISAGTSDFVLAFNKEIIVEHLVAQGGKRRLQILPLKIINSPTVMFFKKHSVLAAPISNVLSNVVEAGFTQLMHARYLRHRKFLFQKFDEDTSDPLTIDNFKSCMMLLGFGWGLSIIFFAAEAYCGRLEFD